MKKHKQTQEEKLVEFRKQHLNLLEEITSFDQVSVNDRIFRVSHHQFPDVDNVGEYEYYWNWNIGENFKVVDSLRPVNKTVEFSTVCRNNFASFHSFEETDKSEAIKIFKANPFHTALALTASYVEVGPRTAADRILMPEMPPPQSCDHILLTIFTRHLDEIVTGFQGFKDFDTANNFHKAFRSWGVLDNEGGILDSIVWDALQDSKLFWYFYHTAVLEPLDKE